MSLSAVPPLPQRDQVEPIFAGAFTPGSDEWEAFRADKVGGSEIGCVIGVGFTSAYALHWRKLGVLDDQVESPEMEWGTRLEGAVLAKFADEHPHLELVIDGWSCVHRDRRWQLATPDAQVVDDHGRIVAVVEAKTAQRDDAWGEPGPAYGQVPTTYRAQVLQTCDVMGVREAWLAVLIGGCNYREYHFDLDDDPDADADILILREHGARFVADLKAGVHPEPNDGSESTYEAVRVMHPDIEFNTVGEIDQEIAAEFTLAVIAEDEAKAEKRRVAALVMEQAGNAHHLKAVNADGTVDHDRFAYRTARRKADGSPGTPYVQMDPKAKKAMNMTTIQEAVER